MLIYTKYLKKPHQIVNADFWKVMEFLEQTVKILKRHRIRWDDTELKADLMYFQAVGKLYLKLTIHYL